MPDTTTLQRFFYQLTMLRPPELCRHWCGVAQLLHPLAADHLVPPSQAEHGEQPPTHTPCTATSLWTRHANNAILSFWQYADVDVACPQQRMLADQKPEIQVCWDTIALHHDC